MEATGPGTQEPQTGERREGEQTYVVQHAVDMTEALVNELRGMKVWVDVATVSVPPRTKRRTIIEKALEANPGEAPAKNSRAAVAFRVLDAESSAEIPVLRIG